MFAVFVSCFFLSDLRIVWEHILAISPRAATFLLLEISRNAAGIAGHLRSQLEVSVFSTNILGNAIPVEIFCNGWKVKR